MSTMSTLLEISTLGTLNIKLNGQPVSGLASRKAEALLVYLACTPGAHTRDVLATLLWDDRPQKRALGNLSVLLSSLRKQLGPYLLINRQTVAFDRTSSYWLDVAVLERLENLDDRSASLPNSALAALEQSVTVYEGDFLASFHVRKASGFEEWVLLERERIRQGVIHALDYLIGCALATGNYQAGVEHARRLLDIDPLREQAHRQMMRLLARSGERAAALAHYESCRALFAEELGVEPLPETVEVYQQIRTMKPHRPLNLPPQPTPFVGRQQALTSLNQQLSDPSCRLLTLIGPGGIGKTRLAVEVAHHCRTFLHGIYFVPLTGLSSAEMIIPTIANAVGLAFYGKSSLKGQLIDFLRQKELLLILDNCEHLLDGLMLLSDLLAGAPSLNILATSRERLNLQEEWLFEVDGLAAPVGELSMLSMIERFGAVQLFVQSAQRVSANFVLSTDNRAYVAQICQLVEGMPLAIELAASWVRLLSPADIVAEIERNVDFLSTSLRNLPRRHRSIRAVFDHSWQTLEPLEQQLFCKLSMFRGGFDREAAKQVADASLWTLLGLADKSFIRRTPSGRFEVHELLRQLAHEKLLKEANTPHDVQARHADYYLKGLAQQKERLKGHARQEAIKWLSTEQDNILLAWQYALDRGEATLLPESVEGLAIFYDQQGRYQEGITLMASVTTGFADLEHNATSVYRQALTWQGHFQSRLGAYDKARYLLNEALTLSRRVDLPDHIAHCYHGLGRVAYLQGKLEEAHTLCEKSVTLFEQVGDQWHLAYVLKDLGNIVAEMANDHDYSEAEQLYARSLKFAEACGDPIVNALLLINLGAIFRVQKEWDAAKHYYQKSVALCQTADNQRGLAIALGSLGYVLYRQGAVEKGIEFLQQSLEIKRNLGAQHSIIFTLHDLGTTMREVGDFTQAKHYYQEGLALALEIDVIPLALYILTDYALLYHKMGQSEAGIELLGLIEHHDASLDYETRENLHKTKEEISATLPASVVQAALTRGKTLKLEREVQRMKIE